MMRVTQTVTQIGEVGGRAGVGGRCLFDSDNTDVLLKGHHGCSNSEAFILLMPYGPYPILL